MNDAHKRQIQVIDNSLSHKRVKESYEMMFLSAHPIGSYIKTDKYAGFINSVKFDTDNEGKIVARVELKEIKELVRREN